MVGFADKLRLMNLLIDDIRPFKEYSVRGCREVRTAADKVQFLLKPGLKYQELTHYGEVGPKCVSENFSVVVF